MSYDLFLDTDTVGISREQFRQYFSGRSWYTLTKKQAYYENQDTGVYFHFDYAKGEVYPVAFHLNYFRPHFFGLEAAHELTAFVHHFDCSILDPQQNGMKEGPYSVDGFLRGWNTGNQSGVQSLMSNRQRPTNYVCTTMELERVWNWNYRRKERQEGFGVELFVPKIMFMKGDQRAKTAVIWPDGCPIALPKVDVVIMVRDELSSQPYAVQSREITLVDWSLVQPQVEAYADSSEGYYHLCYADVPQSLANFIRQQPIVPHHQELSLQYDDVLNAEWIPSQPQATT